MSLKKLIGPGLRGHLSQAVPMSVCVCLHAEPGSGGRGQHPSSIPPSLYTTSPKPQTSPRVSPLPSPFSHSSCEVHKLRTLLPSRHLWQFTHTTCSPSLHPLICIVINGVGLGCFFLVPHLYSAPQQYSMRMTDCWMTRVCCDLQMNTWLFYGSFIVVFRRIT